jgi:hypothetical protein
VRHDDLVVRTEHQVALVVQLAQRVLVERVALRRPAGDGERAIDGKPDVLRVHARTLRRSRDRGRRRETHDSPTAPHRFRPAAIPSPLDAIKRFMSDNNAVIMMVVLLLFGAKLLGDGLAVV